MPNALILSIQTTFFLKIVLDPVASLTGMTNLCMNIWATLHAMERPGEVAVLLSLAGASFCRRHRPIPEGHAWRQTERPRARADLRGPRRLVRRRQHVGAWVPGLRSPRSSAPLFAVSVSVPAEHGRRKVPRLQEHASHGASGPQPPRRQVGKAPARVRAPGCGARSRCRAPAPRRSPAPAAASDQSHRSSTAGAAD